MEELNINETQQLEGALGGVAGVARQAENALGSLDNKLLTLRLNFGKLRAAIERAFAPIASHGAVAMNGLVRHLTDFANSAGAVIGALFGTVQKKAVTTVKTGGRAIRRFLADFDEIARLNAGSGGSGTATETQWKTVTPQLTEETQAIVDKILGIIAPIREISLEFAREAFRALGKSIGDLAKIIGENLLWAWHNILAPLAKWTLEKAAPAAVEALAGAFSGLAAILKPVLGAIRAMLPAVQPVIEFLGQTAVLALDTLKAQLEKLAGAFTAGTEGMGQNLAVLGQRFAAWLTGVTPIFAAIRDAWLAVLGAMGSAAASTVSAILTALTGLTGFLSGTLTGSWKAAWEGLKTMARGAVNGLIGIVNGMLSGLVGGINAAARQLNRFRVNLPSWLPGVGGKSFGFSVPTLSVPQIPYLAQGAVLPAGRPFLAMVGDQRHGTNIEAPLATIQEAVAVTMEDFMASNRAGQEATVGVLREILTAVLGIELGDAVLGAAANRYNARLATMRGDG